MQIAEYFVELNHFYSKLQNSYTYLSVIIIMFDNVLDKAKDFWAKHKYKILAGVSFIAASYFALKFMQGGQETKWSSFIQAIRQNKVKQVVVDNDVVFFRSETSQWFRSFMDSRNPSFIWSLIKDKDIIFSQKKELIPAEIYPVLLSCSSSILSFKYLMGSLKKQDHSPIDLKGTIADKKTFFDDIYGGQEIKMVLREVIHFLKDPQFFEDMGARIRRGVLFYGPPGTGKTMLARALAVQAGCQFIRVTASQFQQLYVGVGPKRVRQLFKAARRFPEGCIIFIDQIDALGSRANGFRDNHQTTTTINQFLNQMDGFSQNQKIVVVAATNKIGLVDHAVLRAGRFDLKVHIPLPNQQQRKGILWKVLDKRLGNLHKVQQKAVDFVGESSENWCGADLECLVNQAIYRAISQNSPRVEDQHILSSFQEMLEMRQMK